MTSDRRKQRATYIVDLDGEGGEGGSISSDGSARKTLKSEIGPEKSEKRGGNLQSGLEAVSTIFLPQSDTRVREARLGNGMVLGPELEGDGIVDSGLDVRWVVDQLAVRTDNDLVVLGSNSGGRLRSTLVAGIGGRVGLTSPGHGPGGMLPLGWRWGGIRISSSRGGCGGSARGGCSSAVLSDGPVLECLERVVSFRRGVDGEHHSLATVSCLSAVEPEGSSAIIGDSEFLDGERVGPCRNWDAIGCSSETRF